MNRKETKRYFDRKKVQSEAAKFLPGNEVYRKFQELVTAPERNDEINIEETLVSFEKLYEYSLDLKLNQIALHTDYVLAIGSGLLQLKKQILKIFPKEWEIWANTNIPFIGARTKQNWMQLAQENGVNDFNHLGVSALILILQSIKDLYSSKMLNRFHAFFKESSYPFKEYHSISDVKKLLVTHTFEVKAKRIGLNFSIDNIKALSQYNDVLNDRLLETLMQTQTDGGSADRYLERLIAGKGVIQKLIPPKDDTNNRLSFDRTIAQTKQLSKFYIKNLHKIDEIRIEDIEEATHLLTSLYWEKFVEEITKDNI